MSGINILLIFMGWLLYWGTTTANYFKGNGSLFNGMLWRQYAQDKLADFLLSLFVCALLITIGPEIPPKWIDLSGKLSVVGAGYGSVSLGNKFLPLLMKKSN